jgi:hypothetical protein
LTSSSKPCGPQGRTCYADRGYTASLAGVDDGRPERSQTHPVRRAPDAGRALVQDMGVDLCRAHIAVAEELLDGPDIVVILEQMGGNEWRRV